MLLTILAFIIVLGILVFVHELGHFITAKKAGCQVDEFGFGFPPRVFGIKRGETMYSINAIPLGGFVKIVGEDGDNVDNPRSFGSKPIWQRLLILGAGVGMNLVLAVVLLSIGFMIGYPSEIADTDTTAKDAKIQIVATSEDSPAANAGVKPGDEIRAIQGEQVRTVANVQEITQANQGKEIRLTVVRDNTPREIRLTPRTNPPTGEGSLGIGLARTGIVSYPVHEAIWQGTKTTGFMIKEIVLSFARIVTDLFTQQKVTAELSGPVGIAVLTGQAVRLGFVYVLQFAALLSINLAIINVLPFPGLDGGRALFVMIEAVRRKKLDKQVEGWIHGIGFSLLLLVMIGITLKDVTRFSDRFVRLWDRFLQLF